MGSFITTDNSLIEAFDDINTLLRKARILDEEEVRTIEGLKGWSFQNITNGEDLLISIAPREGFDFAYPDGPSPKAPSNEFASIQVESESGETLFDAFGFTPLTLAEAQELDSVEKLLAYFLSGDDSIRGGDPAQRLLGLAGADLIEGLGGNDTLEGGAGADNLLGGLGRDLLLGAGGKDNIGGDAGNDRAEGGGGADALGGGDGNDTLIGGGGADRITGGFGRDLLTGGAGRDAFVYQTLPAANAQESGLGAARRDTITDFRPGQDRIDVSFISVEPFEFLGDGPLTGGPQIRVRALGANTLVEVSTDADAGAELSMLLTGRLALDAGDFVV